MVALVQGDAPHVQDGATRGGTELALPVAEDRPVHCQRGRVIADVEIAGPGRGLQAHDPVPTHRWNFLHRHRRATEPRGPEAARATGHQEKGQRSQDPRRALELAPEGGGRGAVAHVHQEVSSGEV